MAAGCMELRRRRGEHCSSRERCKRRRFCRGSGRRNWSSAYPTRCRTTRNRIKWRRRRLRQRRRRSVGRISKGRGAARLEAAIQQSNGGARGLRASRGLREPRRRRRRAGAFIRDGHDSPRRSCSPQPPFCDADVTLCDASRCGGVVALCFTASQCDGQGKGLRRRLRSQSVWRMRLRFPPHDGATAALHRQEETESTPRRGTSSTARYCNNSG